MNGDPRRSRFGRRGQLLLALAAVLAGAGLIGIALRAQVSAPAPHSAGQVHHGSRPAPERPGPAHGVREDSEPPPLGPSPPVHVVIPAIGVDSPVNPLGLNDDGTLAVPQPGPHLDQAAWFENSPSPGQPGPAVIEGHVDSPEGPSVFFRLGSIQPGDRIRVRRADGVLTVFRVNAVRDFPKSGFPTRLVYGGDLASPTLRLITCSDFNPDTHHHEGNEVVFAHLVRTSRQGSTKDAS